jgi:F-type H+-transporting ATPase subunit epsilon
MPLHVTIVTQEGPLFEEQAADSVILPGTEGEMGILPRHAAMLTTLGFGELRVRKGGAEESFAVFGGVAEVRPDRVLVLADTAESSYEIDDQKIREAREGAEKLRRDGVPPDKAQAVLQEIRRASMEENILRKIRQRPATIRIKTVDDSKK